MSNPPVTTQIVSLSLGIAGEQRARLSAVNVGTREAELHLLWGSLMLTLTSGVHAEHLRNVWLHAGVNARRLPMTVGGLRTLSGIDPRLEHPGVVLRLWATPEWNVGYVEGRGSGTQRRWDLTTYAGRVWARRRCLA